METLSVDGTTLYFDSEERDAAELIRDACEKSVGIIHERWGLNTPKECRVYVMTSWRHFLFHSAPWPWRILLAASMPFSYSRVNRLWKFAGGWMQRYGKRVAVGVKPQRLIEAADRSIGALVFHQEFDTSQKVQHITCHELTHAFTAHLRLPAWLNEGLAMVTVDDFVGRPTVKPETIEALAQASRQTRPKGYRGVSVKDKDALVYLYVRGYWITRYIEDKHSELLRSLLAERHGTKALESKLASALGMTREEFWGSIDQKVAAHFKLEQ